MAAVQSQLSNGNHARGGLSSFLQRLIGGSGVRTGAAHLLADLQKVVRRDVGVVAIFLFLKVGNIRRETSDMDSAVWKTA